MSRDFLPRLALQAFPRAVRDERGREMLDTLLDASGGSAPRLAIESGSLVRSGLRARAVGNASVGAFRLAADGFCAAAVCFLTLFASSDLGSRLHVGSPGSQAQLLSVWATIALGAALALALIGIDRAAGVSALLFLAVTLSDAGGYDLTNTNRLPVLVPAVSFLALVALPRGRRPNPRRLAWLAPIAALAAIASTTDDAIATVFFLGLLILGPLALALVPSTPRLALAGVLVVTYFGLRIVQDPGSPGPVGLAVLAAIPPILTAVILATAITSARRLQRRSPV